MTEIDLNAEEPTRKKTWIFAITILEQKRKDTGKCACTYTRVCCEGYFLNTRD